MKDFKLKRCPFCGAQVSFWHDIEFNPIGVQCMKCGITVRVLKLRKGNTFGDAMEQIAERWNRRIPMATLDAEETGITFREEIRHARVCDQ